MSNKDTTGTIPQGQMVSFKVEEEVAKAMRKRAFSRMIPLSMWLREAAREKLKREKRRTAA